MLTVVFIIDHDNDDGARQITYEGDIKDFCWSEDGEIIFPAPRGEDYTKAQDTCRPYTVYFKLSPREGSLCKRYCALPVDAGAPLILEDGRWIVSSAVDLEKPDFEAMDATDRRKAIDEYKNPHFHVFKELPMWWNGRGYLSRRRNTVFLCDPVLEEVKPITPRYFDVTSFDCAFGKLIYNGSEYDVMYDYYRGLNMYDLETGDTRCLIEPGLHQILRPMLLDASTALITVEPGYEYDYVYGDFFTVDLGSGEYKKIADYDRIVGLSTINSDSRLGNSQTMKLHNGKLFFITTEDEGAYLRYITKEGVISDRLTVDGSTDSFDICDSRIVLSGLRGNRLSELYLIEEEEERRLTGFNDFILENYSLSTPIEQNFLNDEGLEIRGFIMPPVGYMKGKSYPAILHIHGGPKTAFGNIFHNEMQLWANAGFFVLFCNPRGSDGRGESFADLRTVMGGVDFDDIMQFTDECIDKWVDIDPKRIGVAGGSYGGFMVNWIVGHTHRYAAAVSQRSISNMLSSECTSDEGTGFSLTQYGCTIRDNPEKLWDMSPLKYAHTAITPTLFIHSDEDYRCPLSEGIQMFTALRREGVDAKLVIFHNEEHGLSRIGRPYNRLARLKEILNWFEMHLKLNPVSLV